MKLATVFTDHMVIQQGQPINIFGEGEGQGSVEFLGKHTEFSSTGDSWCVTLEAADYGGPYEMRVVLNGEEALLEDIYVGEVWLAGGQSNMEMPLFRTECGISEAEHCANENIRFFTVPRRLKKDTPIHGWHFMKCYSEDTPWQVCDRDSAIGFSAIGYYVAKELQKRLGCAVGIVSCNWGGVRMESFTGKEWYRKDPALSGALEEWERFVDGLDKDDYTKKCDDVTKQWQEISNRIDYDEIEQAEEMGIRSLIGQPMTFPSFPDGPYNPNAFGCLYESMYSRIIPYGIKGIIWYQGESNSCYGYLERYLAYMRCMRESFGLPDLAFYAVELASFSDYWTPDIQSTDDRFVTGENWAFRREQQQRATEICPNNYLVTSIDLGDLYDIHPVQKQPLAHRMAQKMLKHSYGFDDIYADHPVFRKATFEGNRVTLEFDNAEGLYCPAGLDVVKMYVADESHVLKRARIEIKDDKLILTSDEVEEPVLVRYGFDNYYSGRYIYNRGGLPIAPFRTDIL